MRSKIIRIEGAQSNGPLSSFDGRFRFAHPRQGDGAQAKSKDIGIAELQCAIEELKRGRRVVFEIGDGMRGDRERCRIVTAVGHRRTGMLNRSNAVLLAQSAADETMVVAPTQKCVSGAVIGL